MFKLKISSRKINYWFYFLAVVASILILGFIILFLYNNFYQTITQTKEVIALKQKVAPEIININRFDNIIKNLEIKSTATTTDNVNIPFN